MMVFKPTTLSLVCMLCCLSARLSYADDESGRVAAAAKQVLQTHCVACHSSQSPRGGLNLTTRGTLLKGGETGAVLDLQDVSKSRLLQLVTHAAEPGMPFKKDKLPADQIDILAAWIKAGAAYSGPLVNPTEETWWSLRPLAKPAVPAIPDTLKSWPLNPVDRFVAAARPAKQLGPTPADRRTLLRRVYFDLIGLPPTPDEMHRFLEDRDPLAYERVVDRLLNDPRYGERWARYWMDLVHFAETHGHDQDRPRPNAWPYRD